MSTEVRTWQSSLYDLAAVAGMIAVGTAILHAAEMTEKPKVSSMTSVLVLALSFGLKIPYMWDKKHARDVLMLITTGWLVVLLIKVFKYFHEA